MIKILTISLLLYTTPLFSQTSLNTELIGNISYDQAVNDVWGYIDENGNEYALVGLVGGVSIVKVNVNQLQEVDFVPGVQSVWRDLKTHKHYAYITADQGDLGLTIIDLSSLPDSVTLVGEMTTYFERAHNLYISNGFAFISGSNTSRGADILDLSNPEIPVRVATWTDHYFHDIFTIGDTLYGSAGSNSRVIVLDIKDKTNPMLISQIPFPDGGYSHNAWSTEDGNYLLTSQETAGRTVKMWDVRDLDDPKLVHEYLSYPSQLAHNVHIKGNYAYISHYSDGLKILDIEDREHMVEVGHFDTHPSEEIGFDGNWGAYPFTTSNYIYISDRDYGLFVVSFNGKKGSRVSGRVHDSETGLPVTNVSLEITELNQKSRTDDTGRYKLGMPSAGTYSISISKFGYESKTISVTIANSETSTLDIDFTPKKTGTLLGTIKDDDGQIIPKAKIQIMDTPFEVTISDLDGQYNFVDVPEGSYTISLGKWGFIPRFLDVFVLGEMSNEVNIDLIPGFSDNFELDLGWEIGDGSNNFRGPWQLIDPMDIGFGLPFHPNNDTTPDAGEKVFYARTLSSELHLTSPTFDLTDVNNPSVNYSFHWFPRGENEDLLKIDISNDNRQTWTNLATYAELDVTTNWKQAKHTIPQNMLLSEFMNVRFSSIESGNGSSFALIDDFKILSSITDPSKNEDEIPIKYELFQNYPNPFNGETLISFSLPEEGYTTLRIYNVIGEEIIRLVDETIPVGKYYYEWGGKNKLNVKLSSGIYFYQLKVNSFEKTRKMLFLE